ncbi:hypothetical protein A9X75_11245 [Brachyspira hyodysenteriae]|uniref:hypothetical protein n=1 Tax=Brachyspira hyodysenteriae TaxID=159 RepID=UPI0011839308|nr:hypothetical protein [Brachyspira hyodysenteriae]TVL65623.1 hypothetical protein A9X75_11245 [Brachyspira hyodysenteriae]
MSITIFLNHVFFDFQVFSNDANPCDYCDLEFYNGLCKADYQKEHIQQLYLLRYSYAYIFEYQEIYKNIFEKFNILKENRNSINILSIGAGSCLDYYAILDIFEKNNNYYNLKINYKSIDPIDWLYKPEIDRHFYNEDINKLHTLKHLKTTLGEYLNTDTINDNIIIFPKSISEISQYELSLLPDKIMINKIYLVVSFRNQYDRNKLNKLLEVFKEKNFFYDKNSIINYDKIDNSGIASKGLFDIYPDDIIKYMNNLSCNCNKDKNICQGCNIDKDPILKKSYMNYIIIPLIRVG